MKRFEREAFSLLAKRSTFRALAKEARARQKGSQRGWWDDDVFVRMIENKLKRTKA